MQAAWYEKTGPAADVLTLGEMANPEPGAGDVLIRLQASGVNPADVKLRVNGNSYGLKRIIPNSDGAGIVEAVGDGVQPHWVGRRVWLFNGQRLGRAFGTAAEWIALPSHFVTELADHLSFQEGATLGIPAMTAYHAVFANGPVAGKTVVVTGGAGAVGFYAAALAHWGGARVLATVSGPEKAAHAKLAGAAETINYRQEDVAARVLALTDGRGADHVASVDFGGDVAWMETAMALNGVVTAYASDGDRTPALPYHAFGRKNVAIRPFTLNSLPPNVLDRTRWGVDAWTRDIPDALRPVGGVYPLNEIVRAHEAVERGEKLGTIVVTPAGDAL